MENKKTERLKELCHEMLAIISDIEKEAVKDSVLNVDMPKDIKKSFEDFIGNE